MARTVSSVYTEACQKILEDTGMSLVYSQTNALQDLLLGTRRFLQETGIIKDVYSFSGVAGTSTYDVPDNYMEVQHVFWNGKYLQKTSGFYEDESDPTWQSDSGAPEYWREDQLSPNQIQLLPKPESNGTITIIATVQADKTSYAIGDNISLVPDSFCVYLKYFILSSIFSQEGEARDMLRAAYSEARCKESINIGKAIATEDLADTL